MDISFDVNPGEKPPFSTSRSQFSSTRFGLHKQLWGENETRNCKQLLEVQLERREGKQRHTNRNRFSPLHDSFAAEARQPYLLQEDSRAGHPTADGLKFAYVAFFPVSSVMPFTAHWAKNSVYLDKSSRVNFDLVSF